MAEVDTEEGATIQMTSFIDCMFILVIFLMVLAVLKKVHHELDITLPDAGYAREAKTEDITRIITVTRDGRFYVGEKEVTRNKIVEAVKDLAVAKPGVKIRVDADKNAVMSDIVFLLDACEFHGLQDVGVRVRD